MRFNNFGLELRQVTAVGHILSIIGPWFIIVIVVKEIGVPPLCLLTSRFIDQKGTLRSTTIVTRSSLFCFTTV